MEILKIHNNPERAEWAALTERFTREEEEITRQVTEILADVQIRRRPLAARSHPPRRGARSPDVRNSGRRARRSRRAHPRRAERGPRRRESEHRDLPPRPAAARGRHRDDAGRPVRAARRADPPRGPLHPGRQGAALLHGADAGRPGPRRRLRGGRPLHPRAAPTARIAPEILYAADAVRRATASSRVGGAQAVAAMAYGTREHPARRQDLRSRQPLRHQAPSNWSAPNDVAVDLPGRARRRCWCWPTTKRRPPSPPPTCCRRPNTEATARRCWSAASVAFAPRHPARRRRDSCASCRRGEIHPRGAARRAASWYSTAARTT